MERDQAAIVQSSEAEDRRASKSPEQTTSAGATLLEGQNRILSKIANGCSIPELLRSVAELVESRVPGVLVSFHLLDPHSHRLTGGVSPTLSGGFLRGVESLDSDWPGGRALEERHSVSAPTAADEWSGTFRKLALDYDLAYCWAHPSISTKGRTVGVLTTFAPAPLDVEERLAEVASIASALAAMGVERSRVIERLKLAQSSIDHSRDAVFCFREDASILYVNEGSCRWLGYSQDEFSTMRAYDLHGELDETRFRQIWRICARRGGLKLESEAQRQDGSLAPAEVTISFVRVGQEGYLCAVLSDITDRMQAEQKLRDSEERYALAARGANDGLWDWNLRTNEVYFSPRWNRILGLGDSESRGVPEDWLDRVHPDDRNTVEKELDRHLGGVRPFFESEHRLRHIDGRYLWVRSRGEAVRDPDGRPTRLAGSLTDITKQKQAEERLLHDAFHDDLTGLPNRALFMDQLQRLLGRARRSESCFAVLFLDFDRFKRINDSLGHMAGDQLLVSIAGRLATCLRPGDTVARLGGDEFSILLDRVADITDATRVADRIHQALKEPFNLSGMEVIATASIGIALGSNAYDRPEDLLRDADTAMYRAKAAGKARHEVFNEEMHARAIEQLKLETELRRAVKKGEFCLLYQPVVSLSTGKMVGFEALTRWQHPQRGLLRPAEFLGVAEETGLIVAIGWWVFREACNQMRRWQDQYPCAASLAMHVNISDKQLFQPDLSDQIEQFLRESGLAPEQLVLDIPENVIMQKAESSVTILGQLKSLDVRIHLDDFGTGYSSLGYLHRFQIDTLKIDRSFIRHMRSGGDNWLTVRTIINLAGNLGMDVIAEGVETEAQLSELTKLGCRHGQGSLFYGPLTAAQADALLRQTDPPKI